MSRVLWLHPNQTGNIIQDGSLLLGYINEKKQIMNELQIEGPLNVF